MLLILYRYRSKSTELERPRYQYGEEEFFDEKRPYRDYPVPKTRQKIPTDNEKYYKETSRYFEDKPKFKSDDSRYYEPEIKPRTKLIKEKYDDRKDERSIRSDYKEDRSIRRSDDYFDEPTTINRRQAQYRQRSPSPEEAKVSPRDRFKDAKEKFLLMERERLEQERKRPEPPISPVQRDKTFLKRHESMAYTSKEKSSFEDRYYDDRRSEEHRPKPAPRNLPEEVRYRRDVQMDRYRGTDKMDPKRRSMFSLIEEEHRKNSNEIAKELKRRSYLETTHYDDEIEFERERDHRETRERDRHFRICQKRIVILAWSIRTWTKWVK